MLPQFWEKTKANLRIPSIGVNAPVEMDGRKIASFMSKTSRLSHFEAFICLTMGIRSNFSLGGEGEKE